MKQTTLDSLFEIDIDLRDRSRILGIIRGLQHEAGSAPLDKIVDYALELGFDKDDVEVEIARLVQTKTIFEPVRYSGNYRVVP